MIKWEEEDEEEEEEEEQQQQQQQQQKQQEHQQGNQQDILFITTWTTNLNFVNFDRLRITISLAITEKKLKIYWPICNNRLF